MSQPVSRILHPFDITRHPHLEPEVEHAMLARWASDHPAAKPKPLDKAVVGFRAQGVSPVASGGAGA